MIDCVESLFQQGKYEEAGNMAIEVFQSNFINVPVKKLLSDKDVFSLAGLLIDIGSRTFKADTISYGLYIFDTLRNTYTRKYSECSLEYNLGNGKTALYDAYRHDKEVPYSLDNIELLVEAKNHYWKALKLTDCSHKNFPELMVNLGNTLSKCARIPEALFYYNSAIEVNHKMPEAHLNRSECLEWLNSVSSRYSKKLIWEILSGYEKSKNYNPLSAAKQHLISTRIEKLKSYLVSENSNYDEIEKSIALDEVEFQSLKEYRKWSLCNYLTLTEHGLYCFCNGASFDDLTIPLQLTPIGGVFVPKMELFLNRLKSEFCLARWLYYLNLTDKDSTEIDNDVRYTELNNGEIVGSATEKIRTAFRLCFGMLDKIANAICELYRVYSANEKVYFESFWKSNTKRWDELRSKSNPGLIGLYTIASDVNQKSGEWKEFKRWRNLLEHGMLVINSGENDDEYGSYSTIKPCIRINHSDFRHQTLRLLHLTRSAIFSFTWAVRKEALDTTINADAVEVTFGRKVSETFLNTNET